MTTRRKLEQERRKKKVRSERHEKVRTFLIDLGLWDSLESTSVADTLLGSYYPRLTVALGEDVPKTPQTTEILRTLEQVIDDAVVERPLLGSIATTDYLSFVWPLAEALRRMITNDPGLRSVLKTTKERTAEVAPPDTVYQAILNLLRRLEDALARYCRIDTRMFHLEVIHGLTEYRKFQIRFVVHRADIRKRQVKSEDGPRPAFHCGQPFGSQGIDWVEWPRSIMGLPDGPRLPVYVQSHALDMLYRTEKRALFIENGEWMVHDYLWQSLRDPKVTPHPRKSGKFLVDYRLNMHKLGYLVARPLEDIVLVETFLFLTMNETPEGNALWAKLRLRKEDKQHLELDRIQTFIMTDVQFDPELVRILSECGCGHLFRILKEPMPERCISGHAERVRQWLRLE